MFSVCLVGVGESGDRGRDPGVYLGHKLGTGVQLDPPYKCILVYRKSIRINV